uniref:Uncharacterized protein n=1 Tax=Myotis myotis TaxID=51298 RepID=A0A7J7UPM1_MYOMY|nr:hypothetical protein mMyoMyo1_008547 [Myotis myotis]
MTDLRTGYRLAELPSHDLEASLLGRALLLTWSLSAPPRLHPWTSLFTGFSSLHLLNLYSGVLSSLSCPMCSSALPPPPPPHESCCLPHSPLPPSPTALQEPHARCLNTWEPDQTLPPDSGVRCLSKAKKVFSL